MDLSAFLSVFLRWLNAVATRRFSIAASSISNWPSGSGRSRTIAEVTAGGGSNASGATSNKPCASKWQPSMIVSRP